MAKRILDEVTKRKLLGMLPFSPGAYVTWTPEEFFPFPLDLQPKFNIRPFDKATSVTVKSAIQAGGFDIEIARNAIKYSVTHWRDLIDLGTQLDVEFSPDAFDLLPEPLVWKLWKKANELTYGLSDEEKEALESQPVSESVPLSKAAINADSTPA